MKFKMHWDAVVDYNGRLEARGGIHIVCAEDEQDAVKKAMTFLHNGAFVVWDAFLENDKFFKELEE